MKTTWRALVERTGIFQAVNPALLREEIKKFGCTDEQCFLGFARDAGLSLVIRGDLDDTGDFINLTLRAYGIGFPTSGRRCTATRCGYP